MKKRFILKFIIPFILVLFVTGCIGARTTYTNGAKIEEIWSIGLFTPTVQMTRMSKCPVEKVYHDGGEFGTPWVENKTVEPCKVIGIHDGFFQNMASPVGPTILSGASQIGIGALISDGLRNRNVSSGSNVDSSVSICQGICGPRRKW